MRRHWSSLSPARDTTRVGVHDSPSRGELLAGGTPGPGETVHRHHLNPLTPVLVALSEPGLEDLVGTRGHVQQPDWSRLVAYGGQVDDDGDVTVASSGVAPRVLVDAEDLHAVEAVRIASDGLLGPGEDCAVGGVPGDPQGLRDA